jgi:hypothetical protein
MSHDSFFDENEVDESDSSPAHSIRLDTIERILSLLIKRANYALTIDCLLLVIGRGKHLGYNITTLATKYNISKEAISKRCGLVADDLDLKDYHIQRSKTVCQIYSDVQKEKSQSDILKIKEKLKN